MKRLSLLSAVFLSTSILGLADPLPEAPPTVTPLLAGSFNLDWDGTLGNTYFVEYSSDLISWQYMPVIKSGTGIPLGYGFFSSDKLFLRLHYTDIPTSDPLTADFDGDGISNWDEVKEGGNNTDPFLYQDLNGNGIADDWELFWNSEFSVFPKPLKAELTYRGNTTKNIYLSNPVSPDANFTITLQNNIAPNQVGYTSTDSITGTAVYAWNDISTTGTSIASLSSVDDGSAEIALTQITIPFYGTSYNKVFVSSNGLITFGSGNQAYSNQSIPNSPTPNLFIAPFWDDLDTRTSGEIYYKEEPEKLTIQFEMVAKHAGAGTYTFQAVLHTNGEIEFFYKSMTGALDSATVGVESNDGSDGLEIVNNSSYIQNLMAVKVSTVPLKFIKVSPLSGTTLAGNISTLVATFNSWDLPPGTYTANIQASHTGTGTSPWNTPAILEVTNPPTNIAITSPSDGDTLLTSQNIDFRVTATDDDFGVERVEFYDGTTKLGEDTTSSYYYYWNALTAGTHELTAKAIDQLGTETISSIVTVTVLADSDHDSMADAWEMLHFGNLDESPYDDFDNDGYTNKEEYEGGHDPKVVEDTDSDGMPDGWEEDNNFDILADDSSGNPDNDGLTNLQEYQAGTSPIVTDTDDDGVSDGEELGYGTNPLVADNWLNRDSDADGLDDIVEILLGLNPFNADSNSNGMNDGVELLAGGTPWENGAAPPTVQQPPVLGTPPTPDPLPQAPPVLQPAEYDILIESVNISFPKYGHPTLQDLNPAKRYLVKKISQRYAGSNGEVESGPIGINGSSTSSIDAQTGEVTTNGDSFVGSFGAISSPILQRGTKTQNGYDDPPNSNSDGTATIVGVTLLSNENTTENMVSNAATELEDFADQFSPGTPFAYRNVHKNELKIDYKKVQFKFKWKAGTTEEQKHSITYLLIFKPEDDPETPSVDESIENAEVIETIQWDGNTNESEVFVVDPDSKKSGKDGEYSLVSVDLITDLNNDGEINSADNVLRDISLKVGASNEDIEKGTEYHFANDNISNGAWDAEDTGAVSFTYAGPVSDGYGTMPPPPSSYVNDDDLEEIHIKLNGLNSGVVWFSHGSISQMEFFTSRECTPSNSLGNLSSLTPFDLASGAFPETLYIKVGSGGSSLTKESGKYLEMYVGKSVSDTWTKVQIRWTVVKKFGAAHYFHAARDYIMENNALMCVKEHGYPLQSTSPDILFRLCIMREEATEFAAQSTGSKGIQDFSAAWAISNPAVVINGNQNFWSQGWDESNLIDLAFMEKNIANKCHGRVITGGIIRLISSDNFDATTLPAAGSPLAGPDPIPGTANPGGKYVGWIKNPQGGGSWDFAAGQAEGWRAMGGLSTFYASPLRADKAHQMVGYAKVTETGKGVVFTATQIKGVGAAPAFAAEAKLSGVPPLVPSTDPNAIKLFILDSGAGSLGLMHKDPSNTLQDVYIGRKSKWGIPYYVNNYLMFYPEYPRP